MTTTPKFSPEKKRRTSRSDRAAAYPPGTVIEFYDRDYQQRTGDVKAVSKAGVLRVKSPARPWTKRQREIVGHTLSAQVQHFVKPERVVRVVKPVRTVRVSAASPEPASTVAEPCAPRQGAAA